MDVSNDLIALGGGATAALALATSWSTWLTRNLVKEGKLSRDQWTSIAVDSARARLDQNAPVVELAYGEVSGVLLPSTIPGGRANPCPPGSTWLFARDEKIELTVQCAMTLTNRSEKTVYVKAVGTLLVEAAPDNGVRLRSEDDFSLAPGEVWSFWLEARATLSDWARNYEHAEAGNDRSPASGTAWITVRDDNDNGVDDWWTPELSGTPVIPIGNVNGGWQLRPPSDPKVAYITEGSIPKRQRTYWLSRSRKMPLPLPPALAIYFEELEREKEASRAERRAEAVKRYTSN